LSDAEGLGLAYSSPDGIHVDGDTMYVAGTRMHSQLSSNPFHEWIQDLNILAGRTADLDRYKSATSRLYDVDRVVGHSMGGSVALELQRRHPDLDVTTYGAPVVSFTSGDRFRDPFDPFSVLDFGAHSTGFTFPHSSNNPASRTRYSRQN